jgi:hypothetical protein
MLERPPPRPDRRAAERQRRSRARRRRGRVILKVEADEFELVEALMQAGRLDERDGLNRARVEQAVARLISDWASRWCVTRGLGG